MTSILRSQPGLLGNLLCLSWILETVPQDYIDVSYVVGWLRQIYRSGQVSVLDRWIFVRSSVLQVLHEMTCITQEISEMVALYTGSALALLDTVSARAAAHGSIAVSETEHARVASAFLLLKIYKQAHVDRGERGAFLAALPLWQIERVVSVDVFLQGALHSNDTTRRRTASPLWGLMEERYARARRWCDGSEYVWRSHQCRHCVAYPFYPFARLANATRVGEGAVMRSVDGLREDELFLGRMGIEDDEGAGEVAEQEVSYGWKLLRSLAEDFDVVEYYGEVFIKLGLLFWDEDRFVHTPLVGSRDYEALVERFEDRRYEAEVMAYDTPHVDDDVYFGSVFRERLLCSEEIKEWTRSGAQCTFGEWKVSRSLRFEAQ